MSEFTTTAGVVRASPAQVYRALLDRVCHVVETVPDRLVVEIRDGMTVRTTLTAQDGGTLVGIEHDEVPPGVEPNDVEVAERALLVELQQLFADDRA